MRNAPCSPQRCLDELTRSFLVWLAAAQAGDPKATHQLRVYGRRLRVALPLLVRKSSGARVRRTRRMLRDVVRAAGASRDRDVMLGLLRDDLARDGGQHEAAGQLHTRLLHSTHRARKRLAALTPAEEVQQLRTALKDLAGRPVSAGAVLRRMEEFSRALRKDQRKRLKKLGRKFDPVRLHALRRSLRRLRYAAETQDRLSGRKSGAVADLKRLQTRLGDLHDCWNLSEWFDAQAETGPEHGRAVIRQEARYRARRALKDAHRHHRRWLEEHPAQQLESVYWALAAVRPAGPYSGGKTR